MTLRRRRLGTSPLHATVIGLGGNTFGPPRLDRDQSVRVVRAAHDLGVNFIDTASSYGGGESEAFIGAALVGIRDEVILATKFKINAPSEGRSAERQIRDQLETSLDRLRTDRVDLYQLHHPVPGLSPEDLVAVLSTLVDEGKVRAIGSSNHAVWRLARLDAASAHGFATAQNYWNVLHREAERELVPYCEENGVNLLPYHPLGGGYLTGKYRPGAPPPPGTRGAAGSPVVRQLDREEHWRRIERLESLAGSHGRSVGELALAWLAHHEVVGSVIVGASTPDQVGHNVAAGSWELDGEVLAAIDGIVPPPPSPEVPPGSWGDVS